MPIKRESLELFIHVYLYIYMLFPTSSYYRIFRTALLSWIERDPFLLASSLITSNLSPILI